MNRILISLCALINWVSNGVPVCLQLVFEVVFFSLALSLFFFVSVTFSFCFRLCVLVVQLRSVVIKCLPGKQEVKNSLE